MPITGLQLITVTGKYLLLNGSPASGKVTFKPSVVITNAAANEIVYPNLFTVTLGASGQFSVQLPATNDPDLSPSGWTYEVTETINGSDVSRKYSIQLPYDLAGATVDLADIVPAAVVAAASQYVLKSEFDSKVSSAGLQSTLAGVYVTAAGASTITGVKTFDAGATPRYKGPEVFTPEAYGAVGDNVTDDSAAFAAMNAAIEALPAVVAAGSGAIVQLGRKSYYLGRWQWRIRRQIHIKGVGGRDWWGNTWLRWEAGYGGLLFGGGVGGSQGDRASITDCNLNGSARTTISLTVGTTEDSNVITGNFTADHVGMLVISGKEHYSSTGSSTSGSTLVTSLTAATSWAVGDAIVGIRTFDSASCYPAGTTVTAVDVDACTLTTSAAPINPGPMDLSDGSPIPKGYAQSSWIKSVVPGVSAELTNLPRGTEAQNATATNASVPVKLRPSGILATTTFTAEHVFITEFAGDGVQINTNPGTVTAAPNADLFGLTDVFAYNCGRHGLYLVGRDSNAGHVELCNFFVNDGYGVLDESFLGNSYTACHTSANGLGAYRTTSVVAYGTMFNACYSEATGPGGRSEFTFATTTTGGMGGGMTKANRGTWITGWTSGLIVDGAVLFQTQLDETVPVSVKGPSGHIVDKQRWTDHLDVVKAKIAPDYSFVTVADLESSTTGKGVIVKSPDGTRWRITVSNTGALTTTAL